jgi:hypothetical protein
LLVYNIAQMPACAIRTWACLPNGRQRTAPYVVPRSIEALVDRLRAATNGGWALGDARFKLQIAEALGWRVAPL